MAVIAVKAGHSSTEKKVAADFNQTSYFQVLPSELREPFISILNTYSINISGNISLPTIKTLILPIFRVVANFRNPTTLDLNTKILIHLFTFCKQAMLTTARTKNYGVSENEKELDELDNVDLLVKKDDALKGTIEAKVKTEVEIQTIGDSDIEYVDITFLIRFLSFSLFENKQKLEWLTQQLREQEKYNQKWERSLYQRAFLKVLQFQKNRNGRVADEILKLLIVLIKYTQLNSIRANQKIGNDLLGLENLLVLDKQNKTIIFGDDRIALDRLKHYLETFTNELYRYFLQQRNNPSEILKTLANIKAEKCKEIAQWEKDIQAKINQLNQKWLPYLWRNTKRMVAFVYSLSPIQMGSNILPWIFKPITVRFFNENTYIPKALQLVGGGLGLYYWILGASSVSFMQRTYSIARMVISGTLSHRLVTSMNAPRINDEQAIVIRPRPINPSFSVYNISLSFAVLEAIYYRRFQPILADASGIITAEMVTALLLPFSPGFSEGRMHTFFSREEEIHFNRFLLTFSGHHLGRNVARHFGFDTIIDDLGSQSQIQRLSEIQGFYGNHGIRTAWGEPQKSQRMLFSAQDSQESSGWNYGIQTDDYLASVCDVQEPFHVFKSNLKCVA